MPVSHPGRSTRPGATPAHVRCSTSLRSSPSCLSPFTPQRARASPVGHLPRRSRPSASAFAPARGTRTYGCRSWQFSPYHSGATAACSSTRRRSAAHVQVEPHLAIHRRRRLLAQRVEVRIPPADGVQPFPAVEKHAQQVVRIRVVGRPAADRQRRRIAVAPPQELIPRQAHRRHLDAEHFPPAARARCEVTGSSPVRRCRRSPPPGTRLPQDSRPRSASGRERSGRMAARAPGCDRACPAGGILRAEAVGCPPAPAIPHGRWPARRPGGRRGRRTEGGSS